MHGLKCGLRPFLSAGVLVLLGACAATSRDDPLRAPGPTPAGPAPVSFTAAEGTGLSFDLSPDGQWIVFDLLGQLWRIPAEGGDAEPLTDAVGDLAEDRDPNFSPDGRWLVFESHRAGESSLRLLPAAGGEPRRLAGAGTRWMPRAGWLAKPAWSPDGRSVVYTSGRELRLYEMDADSTHLLHAPEASREIGDPAWLPGGRGLVYRDGWQLVDSYSWLTSWLPGDSVVQLEAGADSATAFLSSEVGALSLAFSPDGEKVAYFRVTEDERFQLRVRDLDTGQDTRVAGPGRLTPLRVRWTPDGGELLYVADGRLWRSPAAGGSPTEIPFRARIEFARARPDPPAVRFAEPGTRATARGHTGLALCADGERVALIALGRLWVWPVSGDPRAVAALPPTAKGLTWSPDGRQVAWSAGPEGARSLYATVVGTGTTRRLTALPATSYRPDWSPDGRHIAFLHAWGDGRDLKLAVLDASGPMVTDTSDVRYLADLRSPFIMMEQHGHAAWSPAGDAILVYGDGPARIVDLDGSSRPLAGAPDAPSFLQWLDGSSLVFTRGSMLWRAAVAGDSVLEPEPISERAATYPRADRRGTVLYLSDDGYRLVAPGTGERRLGWPDIAYDVAAPPALLLRDVRVWQPNGRVTAEARDILVEGGRIARIAPAGTLGLPVGGQAVEGGGRIVLPGLIDLHYHVDDPLTMAGVLYWGVTTVMDMGSSLSRAAAFAESAESEAWPGPRVLYGGYAFVPGPMGPWSGMSGPRLHAGDDPAAHRRAISLLRAMGASYAKMMNANTLEAGVRFIRDAREAGLRVGGHGPRFLPFIAAGVNNEQHHLSGVPSHDRTRLYREAGVGIVPTLVVMTTRSRLLADTTYLDRSDVGAFLTPHYRARIAAIVENCGGPWRDCRADPPGRPGVGRFHQAGAPIGAGTDYGVVPVPGLLHWELEELVEAGLSPAEAIAAATSTAARILGAEHEIGRVAEGMRADLLILEEDPTEDIRHTRDIWRLIQGGRLLHRPTLLDWVEVQHSRGGGP